MREIPSGRLLRGVLFVLLAGAVTGGAAGMLGRADAAAPRPQRAPVAVTRINAADLYPPPPVPTPIETTVVVPEYVVAPPAPAAAVAAPRAPAASGDAAPAPPAAVPPSAAPVSAPASTPGCDDGCPGGGPGPTPGPGGDG